MANRTGGEGTTGRWLGGIAFGDSAAPRPTVEADPALKVEFDEALGCHTLALPERPWSNAKGR